MKRLTAALMCVILIFCSTGALGAGTTIFPLKRDDSSVDINDLIRFVAYANGATYVFSYDASVITAITDAGEVKKYAWDDEAITGYGEEVYEIQSAVGHEGTLYVLLIRIRKNIEEGTQRVRGAFLYDVVLDDENLTARLGERVKLDWDDMVDESEGSEYSGSVAFPFIQDGKLVFRAYGYSGQYQMMISDLDSGEMDVVEIEHLSDVAKYKDGKVLIQTFNLTTSPVKYTISAFDLDTRATTTLFEKEAPDAIIPASLMYDAANDLTYYRKSGELWVAQGMDIDNARAISVVTGIGSFSSSMDIMDDGYLLVPDAEVVMVFNPDPDARAQQSIRVMDSGYIVIQAIEDFNSKHPDVEVIRSSGTGGIVEAMMNRSTDMDVYSVDMTTADYAALYNRGFLADLSSSPVITGLVGEMYPAIQQAVTKDGKIEALPVEIYVMMFGYYPTGFSKVGLSDDDAPKTWVELFNLMRDLTDVVDDYSNVVMFDVGTSPAEMRRQMLESLISNYMLYLGSDEATDKSFDSPVLRDILAAFDEVDFDSMGLSSSGDSYTSVSGDEVALFSTWTTLSCLAPYADDMPQPMVLALADDITPVIQATVTAMFVNPFSLNPDMAIAFVESATTALDDTFLCNICPGRNEPIESLYGVSLIEETAQTIKDMEKALERADEDNAEVIERDIKNLEADLEFYESRRYAADAKSIAKYRENADKLRAGAGMGIDVKNSPEIATTIRQYADGAINADTLIRNIDQRLRMMMLEGM